MGLDPERPYRLHARVALRPEPFGALAYHYGNRRLTFLKSPELVELVRDLDHHDSVSAALEAHDVGAPRRRAYLRALATLEASEVIGAR
ncbi:MAG: mycofactocin biosynthesis chaperone MftB [Nocardioidaceae bacterium]